MSGAYVVQGAEVRRDTPALAGRLAAQLAWSGDESVNHFAVSEGALLGVVSPDPLRLGAQPRWVEELGVWGAMLGALYESDFLSTNPNEDYLSLIARLWRDGRLVSEAPRMNGAFFVLLWDPGDRRLVAINDRFGLYPMYWSHRGDEFCLASRALCSVLAGVVPGEWNPAGVAQLLTTNDFLGETTLVNGVEAFPQATVMEKQGTETPEWTQYWHYDYSAPNNGMTLNEAGAELARLFQRSVDRQAPVADGAGVTLSGGLDSRCIVAAARHGDVPIQTFTWGKPESYDRRFARKVAEAFGATHHDCEYEFERYPEQFEAAACVHEGFVNGLDVHMLAHLHILEDNVDLVLNGYAGDIVLGGSFLRGRWMREMAVEALARTLFDWRVCLIPEEGLGEAMVESVDTDSLPSSQYRALLSAMEGIATPDKADRFFLENRQRRYTNMGTVLMRCGVESAACFFDYDLIDFTTTIPAGMRFEHRAYLKMMAHAYPKALRLPLQRTLLPAGAPEWANVAAKGFLKGCKIVNKRLGWPRIPERLSPVDFARWMRGPLRPWMESVCMDDYPVADDVLRKDYCRRMWEEHVNSADRTTALGTIAALRGFSTALRRARAKEPAMEVRPQGVIAGVRAGE